VQSAQNQTRRKASTNQTNFADDVSFGTTVRTYRLAVAATGEYTAFHGGTRESALAAIVTAVNRINQVFERDLAVKMELVPNNIDVIYTDAATDPYTDNDALALIDEAQADIDAKIGTENYDIGHVFSPSPLMHRAAARQLWVMLGCVLMKISNFYRRWHASSVSVFPSHSVCDADISANK